MTSGRQTLTFLFTDIEGSTRRWAADAAAMERALSDHDAVLKAAVAARHGHVFKHTGDGICAVFASAVEAVQAAREAQERVALPVRMGLHTGEAEERDGDWYGTTLNRAARIMGAGHGGQVLVSMVTAELLPADIERVLVGSYRLNGLEDPEAIVQIGSDRFPALRARTASAGLPPRRTSLLGRDDLVAKIEGVLDVSSLVTLVGPGGVGKTSVAIEAARRRANRQRVVFADLATVESSEGVLAAVAGALGVTSPGLAALELALGATEVMVVVDNCEHVIEAAADIVEILLSRGAHVVATSREPLELDGEAVVAVPPLADDAVAVALFLERSAGAGGLELASPETARIAELCRRLDGLPLAIELAASRSNVLTVEQLLDHLGERLDLLAGGRRRGRDRHRTLRDTIAWSYNLLQPAEQDLYRTLSVFVDWYTLDDAVAVAAPMRPMQVLDVLSALAAKSLLVVSDADGRARYRYLDSIRDHALELLVAAGEVDGASARMIDHLAATLSALAAQIWEGPDGDVLGEMRRYLPLQQHAVSIALQGDGIPRVKALMMPFGLSLPTGLPLGFAGAQTLAAAMERGGIVDPDILALALIERLYHGDFSGFGASFRRVLSLVDAGQASPELVSMLVFAAGITGREEAWVRELVTRAPLTGWFAEWASVLGEPVEQACLDRALTLLDRMPTRYGFASIGAQVEHLAQALGRPDIAISVADRVLAAFPEPSAAWTSAWLHKAEFHLAQGDYGAALRCGEPVLEVARGFGEHSALVPVYALHAVILGRLGRARDAARVRARAPARWALFFLPERDELDRWLASQLAPDRLAALSAEGRAMELDEILRIAPAAVAATMSSPSPERAPGPGPAASDAVGDRNEHL